MNTAFVRTWLRHLFPQRRDYRYTIQQPRYQSVTPAIAFSTRPMGCRTRAHVKSVIAEMPTDRIGISLAQRRLITQVLHQEGSHL